MIFFPFCVYIFRFPKYMFWKMYPLVFCNFRWFLCYIKLNIFSICISIYFTNVIFFPLFPQVIVLFLSSQLAVMQNSFSYGLLKGVLNWMSRNLGSSSTSAFCLMFLSEAIHSPHASTNCPHYSQIPDLTPLQFFPWQITHLLHECGNRRKAHSHSSAMKSASLLTPVPHLSSLYPSYLRWLWLWFHPTFPSHSVIFLFFVFLYFPEGSCVCSQNHLLSTKFSSYVKIFLKVFLP